MFLVCIEPRVVVEKCVPKNGAPQDCAKLLCFSRLDGDSRKRECIIIQTTVDVNDCLCN